MPIFGTKEIEALQLQVQQLTEKLNEANATLSLNKTEIKALKDAQKETKEELSQRSTQLLQVTKERDASLRSLEEFERSLRASLKQLGTMLEIGNGRWVDPAAIWHVFVQNPHKYEDKDGQEMEVTYYTLFLNSQAVEIGSGPAILAKAQAVIQAKAKV